MQNVLMSKRLQDFIHESMNYGLEIVKFTHSIIPIVEVWQNGQVEINVVEGSAGVGGLAVCDQFIAELPAQVEMYAIIRDDVVGPKGNKRYFLIVEAEERGMPSSV